MSELRLRHDLSWRKISMGKHSVWVVRDPLASDYFYVNDQERSILQLLDGSRSIEQVVRACAKQFAPEHVSAESILRFLADVHRGGMLFDCTQPTAVTCDPVDGGVLPKSRWWQQPFAIRFPGVAVDRWLDPLVPLLQRTARWPLLVACCVLIFAAALLGLVHFDSIATHVAAVASRNLTQTAILLLIVLSLTKVVHELAHALSCRYFGAECRQIGCMLLFGMPTLYCDVSDAWRLPQRYQRIAVSAAGMAAELLIAAIATFAWLALADSTTRDLCVTVMVVCSISTLLFNGNPLLRYDGYYILSDLMGIPNLASEATSAVRKTLRQLLWGEADFDVGNGLEPKKMKWFFHGYWLCSGLYRMFVYTAISLFVYQAAQEARLSLVFALLICTIACIAMRNPLRSLLALPNQHRSTPTTLLRRPIVVTLAALSVLALALVIPLPHHVSGPAIVMPADSLHVFVTMPGRITHAVTSGDRVIAGQTIAELDDPALRLQRLQIEADLHKRRVELKGLQSRRPADTKTMSQIPVIMEVIEQLEARLRMLDEKLDRLTITAPTSGRVDTAGIRNRKVNDARIIQTWAGSPLDGENRGAWLETGTTLCTIGSANRYEAMVLLEQPEIQFVEVGQSVSIHLPNRGRGSTTGQVTEVAASPIDELPIELTSRGLIVSNDSAGQTFAGSFFQVRIAIDVDDLPIAIGSTGNASIDTARRSLFARICEWIRHSMR
ncbi:site-2 protease family protein [Novipirellula artificiosorum]|uniref:Peptidase family M50 n=1 Tax=Novipirellula artificiosorum TaxID=2528016 RepID=A0A5C6D8L5_9BACT|nr:site-2 protease family protein [Novipirellula artificiosorum]TWU31546.1 Peptidase family M50 [Novipirellula artificiosorum]